MKSALEEVLRVIASIWQIGNMWLRRVAVVAIAVMFTMLAAAMLVPKSDQLTVIPILALIPVAGFVVLALKGPLVIAAAASVDVGRKAIRAVSLLLAADLICGIYLSLIPISNDRGLVPFFVLVLVTLLLLRIGNAQGFLPLFVTLLAVIITIIFLIGGRDKITDKMHTWPSTSSQAPPQVSLQVSPQVSPSSDPPQVPQIISVSAVVPQQSQTITIGGKGFGAMAPYTGDSDFLRVSDVTRGWNAGWTKDSGTDKVTLLVPSAG